MAGATEYQNPFLCELLCAESERAAASDARLARELAELALRVAERVSGPPALPLRLPAGGHRRLWSPRAGGLAGPRRTQDQGRPAFPGLQTLSYIWGGGPVGAAEPFSADERRVLIRGAREYQDPALCRLLRAESEQAAESEAGMASELAELAVLVAEQISGPPAGSPQ